MIVQPDPVIRYAIDPFPSDREMHQLWRSAWGEDGPRSFRPILERSLAHVGAFAEDALVGFVNVAWDGGMHAAILDTCVHQDWQRLGIATRLVELSAQTARERGAVWLHVDFEPHLKNFYEKCGFRPTLAGLMKLA